MSKSSIEGPDGSVRVRDVQHAVQHYPAWTYPAVLMAALPPALNVFIMAAVTFTSVMWLVTTGKLPATSFR